MTCGVACVGGVGWACLQERRETGARHTECVRQPRVPDVRRSWFEQASWPETTHSPCPAPGCAQARRCWWCCWLWMQGKQHTSSARAGCQRGAPFRHCGGCLVSPRLNEASSVTHTADTARWPHTHSSASALLSQASRCEELPEELKELLCVAPACGLLSGLCVAGESARQGSRTPTVKLRVGCCCYCPPPPPPYTQRTTHPGHTRTAALELPVYHCSTFAGAAQVDRELKRCCVRGLGAVSAVRACASVCAWPTPGRG